MSSSYLIDVSVLLNEVIENLQELCKSLRKNYKTIHLNCYHIVLINKI